MSLCRGLFLLGAIKYANVSTEGITDLDDIVDFGIYSVASNGTEEHRPSTGSTCVIHIPQTKSSGIVWVQFAYDYNGAYYIRRKWGNGNISAWRQVFQ